MKEKKIKKFLNFQIIISVIVLVFIICSFFVKVLADYREISIGVLLIVMAFGNKLIYQRKSMTILYALFGVILIVTNVIRLIAG